MSRSTHKPFLLQGKKNARNRAGFTLAEVVVGVLILGMTITLLGRAVSDALNAYRLSYLDDDYRYSLQEARKEILQIGSRTELEEGGELEIPVLEDEVRDGNRATRVVRIRWEAEIKPTNILDMYVILATIRFQDGGGTEIREERLTVYRQNWDEDDEQERLIETKEEEFRERLSNRGLSGDTSEEF